MAFTIAATSTCSTAAASRSFTRRSAPVSRRVVSVRAAPEEVPSTPEAPVPSSSGRSVAAPFSILNTTNEAINGRAAMLGFVAAVSAESLTHHTVFSQMAGKYENLELVERAYGVSSLGFFGIVALVTLGTLAPRLLEGKGVDAQSFGPFTPGLEKIMGRTAMMGFSGLLILEAVRGASLL